MIGIRDSSGTVRVGRRRARLRLGLEDRKVENRKPVSPETRTLRTTPTTIWLTR